MLRIYSFGPSGSGRMATPDGTTIFKPMAPVDVVNGKSYERARTRLIPPPTRRAPFNIGEETNLARFGRYFSLDERDAPYPPPVPLCHVKFLTEWINDDDGLLVKKTVETSSATYYGPGQTLGTNLDSEWFFEVECPGRLTIVYVLSVASGPVSFITLLHGVHFVDDPTAPTGATILPGDFWKFRQRRK